MGDITFAQMATMVAMGLLGASFSSLDRLTKIRETCIHLGLGGTMAGLSLPTVKAFRPEFPWFGCLVLGFLIGLFIYGLAVAWRKNDKRLEDTNVVDILQRKLDKEGKP